jgi:hypothetical protein
MGKAFSSNKGFMISISVCYYRYSDLCWDGDDDGEPEKQNNATLPGGPNVQSEQQLKG